MRVFSCLWRGEDLPEFCTDVYDAEYVESLAAGIERHVPNGTLTLLTDEFWYPKVVHRLPHVRHERFLGDAPGWLRIMECFRPGLQPDEDERCMWMGLDTVLIGDCTWLRDWDESDVGLPLDPIHPPKPCNAVTTYNRKGAQIMWEASQQPGVENYTLFGRFPSEMVLQRELSVQHNWWPLEARPKLLLSYKKHVVKGADWRNASIVYWHGAPKPHQLPDTNKVKKEWLDRTRGS